MFITIIFYPCRNQYHQPRSVIKIARLKLNFVMVPFNSFEIRNPLDRSGKRDHRRHERSPLIRSEELSDEEVTRILFKTKPRRKFRSSLIIKGVVLVVASTALLFLGWEILLPHSSSIGVVELHRPHVLPTLLSVYDPSTNLPVYALNNTLYERMLHSVDYIEDEQAIRKRIPRCTENLPILG